MGCSNITKVDSVTLNIKISFQKDIDIEKVKEFIQELDYTITSNTEDVVILDTDLNGDDLDD